jgi:exoribonuclease-2
MFPPSLATGPFSLRAGRDCCAVSVGACLNADGSLAPDVVVAPSALRPAQRITYDEADAALAAGSDADLTALAEARI